MLNLASLPGEYELDLELKHIYEANVSLLCLETSMKPVNMYKILAQPMGLGSLCIIIIKPSMEDIYIYGSYDQLEHILCGSLSPNL